MTGTRSSRDVCFAGRRLARFESYLRLTLHMRNRSSGVFLRFQLWVLAITFLIPSAAIGADEHSVPQHHPSAGAEPIAIPRKASQFFVAVDGSQQGDGSAVSPWDLAAVLQSPPKAVRAGDVIWVRGGVYRGRFVSNLSGTADAPITVRGFPGEHVRIDLDNSDQWEQSFFVLGDHVIYQDLEITSTRKGPRTTTQSGSFQTDVNRGGVSVRGHHNKLVNLVVHDLNAGIGYWGDGGEIHGCMVFNNGWVGPDRAHGHGLYLQNEHGRKKISDNVVFHQFGAGIHAFGSPKANLNDLYLEGNVSFNNGAAVGKGYLPERDILVGGAVRARDIVLERNVTYQSGLDGTVDLGYLWGPENDNLRMTENYIVGTVRFLQPFDEIEFDGNQLIGERPVVLNHPIKRRSDSIDWDNNHYVSESSPLFQVDQQGLKWSSWRAETGFDSHSLVHSGGPKPRVFLRVNRYEPGRANITVCNWDRRPNVTVGLQTVLDIGDDYEIHNVFDFYGDPVRRGRYDGRLITLPMQGRLAAKPLGEFSSTPLGTDARFGVFVVRRMKVPEPSGMRSAWVRHDGPGSDSTDPSLGGGGSTQ